jgi:hypothetical protein
VDGRIVSSDLVRGDLRTEWIIRVFVGFSSILLLELLIFKGIAARSLCKSFGVKGLRKVGVIIYSKDIK